MRTFLVLCSAATLGCALPKLAVGGSISTGVATGGDDVARRSVRSALWLAMSYAPHAGSADRPRVEPAAHAALAPEPMPCAIDVACAWEREAAHEAASRRAADAPLDRESELGR